MKKTLKIQSIWKNRISVILILFSLLNMGVYFVSVGFFQKDPNSTDQIQDLQKSNYEIDKNIINSALNKEKLIGSQSVTIDSDLQNILFPINNINNSDSYGKYNSYNINIDNPLIIEDNIVANNYSILEQTLTTSISIDQSLDWLLLQVIVGGQWNTFRLFGIELTDTTIIARLFGLVVTVLISAEIGSILNWW